VVKEGENGGGRVRAQRRGRRRNRGKQMMKDVEEAHQNQYEEKIILPVPILGKVLKKSEIFLNSQHKSYS
jgi:hypothetical protein